MKAEASIQFECPYCGQGLDAQADMAGLLVTCPGCRGLFSVPRKGGKGDDPLHSPTVKVNLPPGMALPKRPERIIKIKRPQP